MTEATLFIRHCEERSDAAIQRVADRVDELIHCPPCFARRLRLTAKAMTATYSAAR